MRKLLKNNNRKTRRVPKARRKTTDPPSQTQHVIAVSDLLAIVYVAITQLIPYRRNPRRNDHVIDRMVSSIREFGFAIPILATRDGRIVDGELRWKAAQKL